MRDTTKVAAVIVGDVTLHFDRDKVLILVDCLYVPNVRRNLISIPSLACNGYSTLFRLNGMVKLFLLDHWLTICIYKTQFLPCNKLTLMNLT